MQTCIKNTLCEACFWAIPEELIPVFFQLYKGIIVIQKKILWRESTPEFKDTHREKAPSSKTPALTKGINLGIW